ncbi:MAG: hypothetical protein CL609_10905 [Anaerolineaceae bacterium]|nr:hypothetical protein [Anaerolineaceae bacterium]
MNLNLDKNCTNCQEIVIIPKIKIIFINNLIIIIKILNGLYPNNRGSEPVLPTTQNYFTQPTGGIVYVC